MAKKRHIQSFAMGGKKYSTDGSMIFDSNQIMTHFLHNLLYLNGDNADTSSKLIL